jgi:ectoine hydroxylase-related dioxygenase (phytanoyl-CoA dioxygenase family)
VIATPATDSGYQIIRGVLSPGEIDCLLAALSAAHHARSRAGARHLMSSAAVAEVANDPRLLALARKILGPTVVPFRATLFDKSPSANWLVPWHQDTALPLRERSEAPGWGPWSLKAGVLYAHAPASALERVVALRLHLDDSTPENGPLRVLPGTHTLGVLTDEEVAALVGTPYVAASFSSASFSLPPDAALKRAATCAGRSIAPVECVVPRGGVVAMRPLLLHASSKSRIDAPRRVLHIEYSDTLTFAGGLELATA